MLCQYFYCIIFLAAASASESPTLVYARRACLASRDCLFYNSITINCYYLYVITSSYPHNSTAFLPAFASNPPRYPAAAMYFIICYITEVRVTPPPPFSKDTMHIYILLHGTIPLERVCISNTLKKVQYTEVYR